MDDIQDFLKDNWPYVVGGIIGLIIIVRFFGSRNAPDTAYAQLVAGNAAALQASTQASIAQSQIEAQERQSRAELDLQKSAIEASSQSNYLQASANMALAVGQSATGVIGQLYQPAISAMTSAAYENAAVVDAAAYVAAAGFASQSDIVKSGASSVASLAQPASAIPQISTPQQRPGLLDYAANLAGTAMSLPSDHWSGGGNFLSSGGGFFQ